jgi:hypothetical protein
VNRLFNRARYDADAVLTAFAAGLEDVEDLDCAPHRLPQQAHAPTSAGNRVLCPADLGSLGHSLPPGFLQGARLTDYGVAYAVWSS